MDVVGGVIVAAQSGKTGSAGGGERGGRMIGVKRASCWDYVGDHAGAMALGGAWEPWNSHRRVTSTKPGGGGEVEREDYELRSVLSCAAASKIGNATSSAMSGRLSRSSSTVGFGDAGFSSDSTRAFLAPFYRPTNPVFVKPVPACSWVDPLRFLLKKELTVTDVGELGRIILPKRDAECQLPHLDSKEGKLLSMEDYNSNKLWTLRYKWWPNNKSRMYVLESTGEFVKFYDLKEKDELIVYKDGVGNLVIRGHKWSAANSLLRSDSFLGPTGFKAKSTGKRSPKGGANTRSNALKGSPTASSSNSSLIQASPSFQAKLDSPREQESADDLDFKLGPANALVNHTMGKMPCNLDCELLPGSVLSTPVLSTSVLSNSVLSTSVLSTSVLNVEHSEISSIGAYGPVVAHSDGVIDWEKLPDPPAIEFGDPPAIEFPGEFECTWGDCI